MSWDGIIAKFPNENYDELPSDWLPTPMGDNSEVLGLLTHVSPEAKFDEEWNELTISNDTTFVEFTLQPDVVAFVSVQMDPSPAAISILKDACEILGARLLSNQSGKIIDFNELDPSEYMGQV